MTTLNAKQIQKLTKAIVKYCIIPELKDFFEFPSYTNLAGATVNCLTESEANTILQAWTDQTNTEIDDQILTIYSDIESFIKDSLKEMYSL